MTAARYFDLVREMKESIYNHRLRLVESAPARGIKPTARLFATTVPTVRKWLRRYQQQGPSGLLARSRARHRQPHKTPATREAQLTSSLIWKISPAAANSSPKCIPISSTSIWSGLI